MKNWKKLALIGGAIYVGKVMLDRAAAEAKVKQLEVELSDISEKLQEQTDLRNIIREDKYQLQRLSMAYAQAKLGAGKYQNQK